MNKSELEVDISKTKQILSLIEENDNLRLSYQEKDDELKVIHDDIIVYEKEFGKLIHCDCNLKNPEKYVHLFNQDCKKCKGKGYYFLKE